jgi:hypothetical protein
VLYDVESVLDYRLTWHTGDPNEKELRDLESRLQPLKEALDFSILVDRLVALESFRREPDFGVSLRSFAPELVDLQCEAVAAIESLQQPPVYKAECFLRSLALNQWSEGDLEAFVYLASRGETDRLMPKALQEQWYEYICRLISNSGHTHFASPEQRSKAESRTISLRQAAEVMMNENYFRFWHATDREADFLDVTMLRAASWLGISGFEPWWQATVQDICSIPWSQCDRCHASWVLFLFCRSSAALRIADRQALMAFYWALYSAPAREEKPWMWTCVEEQERHTYTCPGVAAAIVFAYRRILPDAIDRTRLELAGQSLLDWQREDGAWAACLERDQAVLETTCMAVHALALHQPLGWKKAMSRAAAWLEAVQCPYGFWREDGSCVSMLTVLVLDTLALARGDQPTTLGRSPFSMSAKEDGKGGTLIPEAARELDELFGELQTLRAGHADAYRYQNLIQKILHALFKPYLTNPRSEKRTHGGINRIDITFSNRHDSGFFAMLARSRNCPFVFFECKNYSQDPTNEAFSQIRDTLADNGMPDVGFVVCREWNDREKALVRAAKNAPAKLVLILDDEDLRGFAQKRKGGDMEGIWNELDDQYFDALSRAR